MPGARQHYQKVLAADPASDAARKGLERVDGLAKKLGGDGDGRAVAGRAAPAGGEPGPVSLDPVVIPASAEQPAWEPVSPAGGGRPASERPWVPGPLPTPGKHKLP